jgi:hypothetical protein
MTLKLFYPIDPEKVNKILINSGLQIPFQATHYPPISQSPITIHQYPAPTAQIAIAAEKSQNIIF